MSAVPSQMRSSLPPDGPVEPVLIPTAAAVVAAAALAAVVVVVVADGASMA